MKGEGRGAEIQNLLCRSEWNQVGKAEQDRIGRMQAEDGEFWSVSRELLLLASFRKFWSLSCPEHLTFDCPCPLLNSPLVPRMTLSDFCLNFDEIEVCHLTEATLSGLDTVKPWQCTLHQGSWVPSLSAGGPPGGGKTISVLVANNMVTNTSLCGSEAGFLLGFPITLWTDVSLNDKP